MKKLAVKILWIVNIVLAVFLLFSYTAAFINPKTFVWPAFFGLAYPYLLLVNLVFFFYWLIQFRKRAFLSLVVILLGWNYLVSFVPLTLNRDAGSPEPDRHPFKVMSYNVRGFDLYKWSEEGQTRESILKLVSEENPAIICFQEFYTSEKQGEREEDIKRHMKFYPYQEIYYNLKSTDNSGFGVATFSKYPIVKRSRIPFAQTLNQAVYTDIKVLRDTIRVINVHLQSIQFGKRNYDFLDTLRFKYPSQQVQEMREIGIRLRDAFAHRSEQAQVLSHYIRESPYPVIVMGDFNDTPVSYAYRRVRRDLEDSFTRAGSGFGNTYAGELPSFRIDYILHSDELETTEFDRIKTKFSDHYPITATLHVRDNPRASDQ